VSGTRSTREELCTVAFLPVNRNPYQHLLSAELEELGIAVEFLDGMPGLVWLLRERQRVPILHLHWLHGLYMRHLLTPLRLFAFWIRFSLALRLGYSFVWTVHNILPHRRFFPPMDRQVRRLVMRHASAVITHCEYGRREILRLFPSEVSVHVVPHGNYAGVHAVTTSSAEARASLGVQTEGFVYLLLGNILPYKGTDTFLRAFEASAGPNDVALIAGRNRAPAMVRRLEARAAADARVHVHARFIPDDQMQCYLRAADVAVFCFQEVLTSGSVILAMTHGLPVIAPARGCLPELVTPAAGLLFDPDDPSALGKALRNIKEMDTAEMGVEARRIADGLSWKEIARKTAAVYWDCVR
jgi:glycosyltransferase involved in cell wall biosynthesis